MTGILHTYIPNRVIDSNGISDGASIAFYVTGTTTPAAIYSDAALTTPLANPVVVGAGAAVPDIYLDPAITYRRVVTYSSGGTQDTDPWTTLSAETFGFLQDGTGAVTRSLQDKLRDFVSVLDFIPVSLHEDIAAGTDETDLSTYIQKALNTGRNVYIPNGTYWVDVTPGPPIGNGNGLRPVSNQTIYIESGATIRAIASDLEDTIIIECRNVENVTIEGGGTLIGEREDHVGTTGENGMGISLYNATNITIRGITIRDCWGDGIYIGQSGTTELVETLEDVVCDVPIQLGLADRPLGHKNVLEIDVRVGGVLKTVNTDYTLDEINGTLAGSSSTGCITILSTGSIAAGADVEVTYDAHNYCRNIVIEDVICDNNRRNGISPIAVERCRIRGGWFTNHNGVVGAELGIDVEPNPTKSSANDIVIDGATCERNTGSGLSVTNPHATNVTLKNVTSCWNGLSGLNSGSVGPGLHVSGGTYHNNTLHGLYIFGSSPTYSMGHVIENVNCHRNTLDGIALETNIARVHVLGGQTHHNGRHGVRVERVTGSVADDILVQGVRSWNNSQTTDQAADNILITTGTHYVRVVDCWTRRKVATAIVATNTVTPTKGARYNIQCDNNDSTITIERNDVTDSDSTKTIVAQASNVLRNNLGYVARRDTTTLVIPVGDETTAITAGTGKVAFRMPHRFTLTAVRASLTTAQASGNIFTVDINESGTSVISTKLTIDNTEKTSTTAATPAVISDATLADDAEITIDVDQIGDGTAKGLKVYLIGTILG